MYTPWGCTTWTLPKVHEGSILADYHMVRACNPSVLVAQWDCSCIPSEPKAQPGLGSDVPPDQLAFPSCDGKGKVRNVRLLLFH